MASAPVLRDDCACPPPSPAFIRPTVSNLCPADEHLLAAKFRTVKFSYKEMTEYALKHFSHRCAYGAKFSVPFWRKFMKRHNLTYRAERINPVTQTTAAEMVAKIQKSFMDARRAVRTASHHLAQSFERHGLRHLPASHVLQVDEINVWVGPSATKTGRMREKTAMPRGKSVYTKDPALADRPDNMTRATATIALVSSLDGSFVGAWVILTGRDRTDAKWQRATDPVEARAAVVVTVSGSKDSAYLPTSTWPQLLDCMLSMRRDGVPAVIIADNASVHNDPHVPALLRLHDNSQLVTLPGGTSAFLQPHDLGANFVFRLLLHKAMKAHPTFQVSAPDISDHAFQKLLIDRGIMAAPAPAAAVAAGADGAEKVHADPRSALIQCVARAVLELRDKHPQSLRSGWVRSGLDVAMGFSHVHRVLQITNQLSYNTADTLYTGGGPQVPVVKTPPLLAEDQTLLNSLHVRYHTHAEALNNHGDNEFMTHTLNANQNYNHCARAGADPCRLAHPDLGPPTAEEDKKKDYAAQELYETWNLVVQTTAARGGRKLALKRIETVRQVQVELAPSAEALPAAVAAPVPVGGGVGVRRAGTRLQGPVDALAAEDELQLRHRLDVRAAALSEAEEKVRKAARKEANEAKKRKKKPDKSAVELAEDAVAEAEDALSKSIRKPLAKPKAKGRGKGKGKGKLARAADDDESASDADADAAPPVPPGTAPRDEIDDAADAALCGSALPPAARARAVRGTGRKRRRIIEEDDSADEAPAPAPASASAADPPPPPKRQRRSARVAAAIAAPAVAAAAAVADDEAMARQLQAAEDTAAAQRAAYGLSLSRSRS